MNAPMRPEQSDTREPLLLLIHRIPYPPNKGDKIRSYHLLKHLAQRYRVHLATFVDNPDDWQHVPTVQALCASSHFMRLHPVGGRVRSLGSLLKGTSLSRGFYRDAGMQAWVDQAMATHAIKRVVIFSSVMAQYVESHPGARRVVDFCDVDSDKWRQYAEKKSWPMNWLYRHESRKLLQFERQVAQQCDASLFVSAPEAALFRELAPESGARIDFFNNGVDTEYFSPERHYDNPYQGGEQAIVFTGAMDYWPNIDAVKWFAAEVLPELLRAHPALRFYIVGARPAPEVLALGQQAGIAVTGTVPDVRPYLAHATVAVAPLRIARGVQNKVLEAMAMAKAVVVSPEALEGIEAEPGRELLLARDASAFAAAVGALCASADHAIGAAARQCVEQQYSWPSNLARIDARLECA